MAVSAQDIVLAYLGWDAPSSGHKQIVLNGNDTDKLLFHTNTATANRTPNDPVEVTIYGEALPEDSYEIAWAEGVIRRTDGVFPKGYENVTLSWENTAEELPPPIQAVIEALSTRVAADPYHGAIQSQRAGTQSVTYSQSGFGLLKHEKEILDRYRLNWMS